MNLHVAVTVLCLLVTWNCNAQLNQANKDVSQLDLMVAQACDKNIVMLGEDAHHGSGNTVSVKGEIITRLINQCGFSAVLFESPVYEFFDYDRQRMLSSSTRKQLAAAIGGLWANAHQMQPLISFLHQQALSGDLYLGGIDAQFGRGQPFAQKVLPKQVSQYLPGSEKLSCQRALYRFLNWQYDDNHKYDKVEQSRIAKCVNTIVNALEKYDSTNRQVELDLFMAQNFAVYLSFRTGGDYFNLRDTNMAQNIQWHLDKLPQKTKVIIWSASIHVAKTLKPLYPKRTSMATHLTEGLDGVMSIGFSALGGEFGRSKQQAKLIQPALLAEHVYQQQQGSLMYLNKHQLQELGAISAQPIQYGKKHTADWSTLFDGMIFIRNEEAYRLLK